MGEGTREKAAVAIFGFFFGAVSTMIYEWIATGGIQYLCSQIGT